MNDDDLARALRALPVPEHRPGFWARLEAELADDAYVRSTTARRRRWPVLAATLVLVAAAGALLLHDDPAPVTTTQPSDPIDVAARFVAAARDDDAALAASLVGPGTKGFARAWHRTIGSLLADQVWPDPESFLEVEVDATHRVVVLDDALALPVREVAGRWLAEPWAYDLDAGSVGLAVRSTAIASGELLEVTAPVEGVVHLGLDREVATSVETTDRTASWIPREVGRHVLLAALVQGDTFLATARTITIDPEPASAEGAAGMFRYSWLVADRERMAGYGSPAAVDQAAAIPIEGWGAAHDDGCDGAAGSVYCTWTRDDGARLVLRVGNVERPPQVLEVRVEP
jgi:hypothetical protein